MAEMSYMEDRFFNAVTFLAFSFTALWWLLHYSCLHPKQFNSNCSLSNG